MPRDSRAAGHGGQPTIATPTPEPRTQASARLRSARLAAGLTQEQAAGLRGVDARQVRRWENGESPLGALELLLALEAYGARPARAAPCETVPAAAVPGVLRKAA